MELLPGIESVFWKKNRLATYDHWPFQPSDVCNSESMAAAGFVAIGGVEEPDLVQCFVCQKQLDGWDPDDDPWDEHIKHQPSCPLVMLGKKDESKWSIADLFQLIKVYKVKQLLQAINESKVKAEEECFRYAKSIPEIYKGLKRSQKN